MCLLNGCRDDLIEQINVFKCRFHIYILMVFEQQIMSVWGLFLSPTFGVVAYVFGILKLKSYRGSYFIFYGIIIKYPQTNSFILLCSFITAAPNIL